MSWRALEFALDLQTTVVCQECGKRVPAITDDHLSKECTGYVKTVEEYQVEHHWAPVVPPDIFDFDCGNPQPVKHQPKKQYVRERKTFRKGCPIGCNNGGQCPNCTFSSNNVVIPSCKIHCHNKGAFVMQEEGNHWYCRSFQVKE